MSVPQEVEKAIDERSRYGILGDATDTMMKVSAAEAMREAAKNPGAGGMFMGAGVGLGAGSTVGGLMAGAMNSNSANSNIGLGAEKATVKCGACGKQIAEGSKFCPECGAKVEQAKSKFCPECGKPVAEGSKFCPECGNKIG